MYSNIKMPSLLSHYALMSVRASYFAVRFYSLMTFNSYDGSGAFGA